MATRLPAEIKEQFLRALRQARIRRIAVWSPVIFVISGAAGGTLVVWRGGGLLHLLSRFKPPFLNGDPAPWFWLAVLSLIAGLLGLLALLGMALKNEGIVTMPYCATCARPDETMRGECETCGEKITREADFLYPNPFDDEKIFRAFGLKK